MKYYVIGIDPFEYEKLVIAGVEVVPDDGRGMMLKEEDTKEYRTAIRLLRQSAEEDVANNLNLTWDQVSTYNLHETELDALFWYHAIRAEEMATLKLRLNEATERWQQSLDAIKERVEWPTCARCGRDCILEGSDWACGHCCGDPDCPICS